MPLNLKKIIHKLLLFTFYNNLYTVKSLHNGQLRDH